MSPKGNAGASAMALITQLEEKVREKNELIRDLKLRCMNWRTKYIIVLIGGHWQYPWPVMTGIGVGMGIGWLMWR